MLGFGGLSSEGLAYVVLLVCHRSDTLHTLCVVHFRASLRSVPLIVHSGDGVLSLDIASPVQIDIVP